MPPIDMTEEKNGGPIYLKAWRERAKLTQAELAEKACTGANMIGYLESGERGLTAKWMRRLGDALGITPSWLMDCHPYHLSDDIVNLWGRATSEQKRQIVQIAATILGARAA